MIRRKQQDDKELSPDAVFEPPKKKNNTAPWDSIVWRQIEADRQMRLADQISRQREARLSSSKPLVTVSS
jgi:hypothetical protein